MRRRRYALIGVLAAAAALWSTRSLAPAARGRPEGPTLVGTVNPRTPIEFSLVLRLPGQARLRHFLDGLQDPASPAYHHFIDAAVFGARFGLPRTVLSRTTAVLARDAVHVTASYPQRTALEVRATAGTIDRLFGLRYQLPERRRTPVSRFDREGDRAARPPRRGRRRRRTEQRRRRDGCRQGDRGHRTGEREDRLRHQPPVGSAHHRPGREDRGDRVRRSTNSRTWTVSTSNSDCHR